MIKLQTMKYKIKGFLSEEQRLEKKKQFDGNVCVFCGCKEFNDCSFVGVEEIVECAKCCECYWKKEHEKG